MLFLLAWAAAPWCAAPHLPLLLHFLQSAHLPTSACRKNAKDPDAAPFGVGRGPLVRSAQKMGQPGRLSRFGNEATGIMKQGNTVGKQKAVSEQTRLVVAESLCHKLWPQVVAAGCSASRAWQRGHWHHEAGQHCWQAEGGEYSGSYLADVVLQLAVGQ